MSQRSTYPVREGFHLDKNGKLETTTVYLGYDLGNVKTVRVVVLGDFTPATGDGTEATIVLQDTDDSDATFHTITSADVTEAGNGVYIYHLRGALLDGIQNVKYTYAAGTDNTGTGGAITIRGVYLDSVEN